MFANLRSNDPVEVNDEWKELEGIAAILLLVFLYVFVNNKEEGATTATTCPALIPHLGDL